LRQDQVALSRSDALAASSGCGEGELQLDRLVFGKSRASHRSKESVNHRELAVDAALRSPFLLGRHPPPVIRKTSAQIHVTRRDGRESVYSLDRARNRPATPMNRLNGE
jgi:hypothetical protein